MSTSIDEQVNCQLSVDNELKKVEYNGEEINFDDENDKKDYKKLKRIEFTPMESPYPGELEIEGEDKSGWLWDYKWPDRPTYASGSCYTAGLVLHCQSNDNKSPWHNFVSDTTHWRVDGNGQVELCNYVYGVVGKNWMPHPFTSRHIWQAYPRKTKSKLIGTPVLGNTGSFEL